MATDTKQLNSARATIEAFARAYEPDRNIHLRGREIGPESLPAPARTAYQFYFDVFNPPDDTYGLSHAFEQLPEDGTLFIVIGNGLESGWGAVEIYSPTGELLATALFYAGMAVWLDQNTARQTLAGHSPPPPSLFKPAKLEWIFYTHEYAFSVGGRFTARPHYDNTLGTVLEDRNTGAQHPCATFANAQALAGTIHAQG